MIKYAKKESDDTNESVATLNVLAYSIFFKEPEFDY